MINAKNYTVSKENKLTRTDEKERIFKKITKLTEQKYLCTNTELYKDRLKRISYSPTRIVEGICDCNKQGKMTITYRSKHKFNRIEAAVYVNNFIAVLVI